MGPSTPSTLSLTEDQIDDLIYSCRAGELEDLKSSIESLASTLSFSPDQIVCRAVDVDSDGLGSGTCLLHYPAANGNLEIITYLLSVLAQSSQPESTINGTIATSVPNGEGPSKPKLSLVNHQNVSGNTPLHWAALNGHLEVVKALVDAGADPTIVNGAGRDAVVEAEYSTKEAASSCADWMLRTYEGLEQGAGVAQDRELEDEDDNAEHADGDEPSSIG